MRPDYTPAGVADFDAENEWRALHAFVKQAEQLAESAEVTEELRQQALSKEHAAKDLGGAALDNQIRKNRFRWLREHLTESGMKRAAELGWPNTYTLTKSLAESLIAKYGRRSAHCRGAACDCRNLGRKSRSLAGMRASILQLRSPICSGLRSASFRRTKRSGWTLFRWIRCAAA